MCIGQQLWRGCCDYVVVWHVVKAHVQHVHAHARHNDQQVVLWGEELR